MTAVDTQSLIPRAQGRVLSTMENDGSRRWLFPRLARGAFWKRRRVVAYALIAIYALLPHLRTPAGKPVMLLDVLHRRFTLLGHTFLPTDTVLLALFMVALVLTIFFATALLGRVWCGWACPQTVYMEFLFRPMERMFSDREGVGGKASHPMPAWRKALMYLTFLVVCLHLSNTFLAYFVPPAVLHGWITSSPLNHPAGFLIVATVTGLMMFDFCFFREQTCLIACPYGRIQSVMMDRQSLIISYDVARGEPRTKIKRTPLPILERTSGLAASAASSSAAGTGDCIDCSMCVSVCPTGIDIRDGLQFECISCSQCIDACDAVMDKVNRPRGLIRYGSQAGMAGEPTRILRPRVIVYAGIIATVLTLLTVLLIGRSALDVTVLRNLGRPFVITDAGEVENTMRLKLTNRTDHPVKLVFFAPSRPDVRVIPTSTKGPIELQPMQSWTEALQVVAPRRAFTLGACDVTLRVSGAARDGSDSFVVDRPCRLLGPSTTVSPQPPQPKGASDASR